MITLKNINLSSIDLSGIDLRGIKLGLGGRGGGSGDGFPVLPGDVTRWHFGGLTNEMMAAMDDPRIEDADHKGRFLSFKNFAWSGMSGVGGYEYNFLSSDWVVGKVQLSEALSYKITIVDKKNSVQLFKYIRNESENTIKITLKVTGIEINGCTFRVYDNASMSHTQDYKKDGIYQINYTATEGSDRIYFYVFGGNMGQLDNPITIEQLPLYPGALVFDGVDDYGTCDNFPVLTKEKGYTVVALRSYLAESIGYLVYNGTNAKQSAFAFERSDSLDTWSWGKNSSIRNSLPKLMSYQTSNSYNNNPISTGEVVESNNIINVAYAGGYCNVAIWEIVILDHDATEEELTKIKDYFVKTYPWLFPDQAWTVVGKTNEDKDRATIANITGNGNDLILSNFGFAEGSGYGLYGFKFFSKAGIEYYSGSKISFSKHQLDQITLIPYILVYPGTSYPREKDITAKIKVAGLKEGVSLTWGWAGNTELTITEDGTYSISAGSGKLRQLDVVYAEGFDPDHVVTIEQIPEYEGYLVTDGVDDKIVSAKSIAFTDTWTIITDAIFLGEKVVSAGILVKDIFGVSNLMEYGRVEVSVKGGVLLKVPTPSIKAICSDGRIYDADWNEYQAEPGTIKVSEGKLYIGMWYNGMQFCSIAFKNIATYNGYALSKDDCIKAYNYLQTLKAK